LLRNQHALLDYIEFRSSSKGIQLLLDELKTIRERVVSSGEIDENMYSRLSIDFGEQAESVADRCRAVARPNPSRSVFPPYELEEPGEPVRLSPSQKAQLTAILDGEKRKLEASKLEIIKREDRRLESYQATLNLPSNDALAKILRYETTIERQMYRAIDQLERLQRLRGGQIVPPPINVNVSSEN
jgi:hypothetical protein